jgi:hypothetical protein
MELGGTLNGTVPGTGVRLAQLSRVGTCQRGHTFSLLTVIFVVPRLNWNSFLVLIRFVSAQSDSSVHNDVVSALPQIAAIATPCWPSPCNSGQCVVDPGNENGFTCECPEGTAGTIRATW